MKLLYCYIMFLDENGNSKPYRGLDCIELNLSTMDKFRYDSITNTLHRKKREKPLPANFWADDSMDVDYHNIYNINVIAGENGSGKTTAIHCVINLLDYLHATVDEYVSKTHRKNLSRESTNRVLLLFEKNDKKYMLDYSPVGWDNRELINITGFINDSPSIFSFHNWETFACQRNLIGDEIAAILLKTKVIYLTNTLNQYDYERHLGERNERLRDFFVFDASIGSTIGPDVSKFFPYEVFKQVKYIFDKRQAAKRKTIQDNIPELRMPHGMVLHLLLEEYQEVFSRSIFPLIGAGNVIVEEGDRIDPSRLDLPILLGALCVASFVENLGRIVEINLLPMIKNNKTNNNNAEHSLLQEMENAISETERAFYRTLNRCTLKGHTGEIRILK